MISRRAFLKTTAVAAPLVISAEAFGRTGPGANDIVNVGLIGLGGRCGDILQSCKLIPRMRVVAVSDCLKPKMDKFIAEKGPNDGWNAYVDFREMIDKENLDAVFVETTTHARAWVACYAMACGLDAYIEKPMSLTIAEGRYMVETARKHNRVTQIGTQQRSIPLNNWASDLVMNGAIGKVTTVLAPNFMGPKKWEGKPEEPQPEGANPGWWDVWLNQSEMRPYCKDLHRGWGWWADYDGGGQSFGVTGWGTHSYDQMQRGLGTSETGPVEVLLEEPVTVQPSGTYEERVIGPDETGAPYYEMVRNQSGPRAKVRLKYASGTEVLLHLDADRSPGLGCIFQGEKGTIEINRDKISATPVELIEGADRPAPLQVPETQPHIENFIDCIASRERCNADIEYGVRSTTVCYLVNIARDLGMVGKTLQWDPEAERFTNCDEGNAMLSRPRREPYDFPKHFLRARIKNRRLFNV
jgi:predicted dehydrogenase